MWLCYTEQIGAKVLLGLAVCLHPDIVSYPLLSSALRVVGVVLRIVLFDPFVQHLSSHGPELQLRDNSIAWLNRYWIRNPLRGFLLPLLL